MRQPLKIGYICYNTPHLGGSGVMSLELAKQVKKRGHDVTIISYPGTYLTDDAKELGIKLLRTEAINYPCFKAEPFAETFASLLYHHSMEEGLDVVHAHYAITHGVAALLAKRMLKKKGKNITVITTSHGSDIHTNGYHKALAPVIENTLLDSDAITFVSDSLKEEAEALFPAISGRGIRIHNFVDTDRFVFNHDERMRMRNELQIPSDGIVIYHASNFRDVKNPEIFVEMARQHTKENIYFLMVGDGPLRSDLEEKAKFLYNLEESFRFVGKQDNVIPYINASDIAVLPSRRESFGLVLLEAMSCGLPVIGSNVGGIQELIEDGENGFLFSDSNHLHDVIQSLATNQTLRKEMGMKGKMMARDKFSMENIVSAYESLYFKISER